jgi:amino acid adenylation domain-containing protein
VTANGNPEPAFNDLFAGFSRSARRVGDRCALVVGGRSYTYAELNGRALDLASTLLVHDTGSKPLAAFLAHRCLTAYASVLGILASGKGYVPLHPKFPVQRTQKMLELSGVDLVIVDPSAISILRELLGRIDTPLTVILPEDVPIDELSGDHSRHKFVVAARLEGGANQLPRPVTLDSTAYLLFTSGSTGVPKGVPISQRNVTSYLHYVNDRYDIGENDRCSQTFDLTFDLSVHDMFVCWTNGASLCCLSDQAAMAPAKFIKTSKLTIWFSVPSVITLMQRMRLLKPGGFPSLRLSLFCGEPLLAAAAEAWQQAAPNSIVDNLYGPTEATIAISHYRWQAERAGAEFVNGIVPIGDVFPSQAFCVIDGNRNPLARGQAGELCVSGSQVTSGYFNNPERTRQQFVTLPERGAAHWYRTGDLVREDESGCLHYLGRIDDQVQVRGHRVEVQEVDHVLRIASGTNLAVAVAWPVGESSADSIYGFVCADHALEAEPIRSRCETALPEYMVPREIFVVDDMPLNVNGKIDRKALARRLGELLSD